MTTKRVAVAAVLTQIAGLAVATAQPTPPPPDQDEARPGDIGAMAEPPAEGTPVEETTEETVAEEVGPPVIERAPTGSVAYDKGIVLQSADEKFEIKLTGRIQPFYSGTFTEDAPDKHAFEIRRLRLSVEGKVHTNIGWKTQIDFGKGNLSLKDGHFDVKVGNDMWLRVGQWKRPFSRQQINSSARLELTTRAVTDSVFGAERDIGFAIRNDYEKSPDLEWIVGVFNGQGVGSVFEGDVVVDPTTGEGEVVGGKFTNVPAKFKPAFIGRVGINQGGIKGYQEADLEGGALRWGAAASVWLEADRDENDKSNQKVELDFIVKNNGLSVSGGLYGMSSQQGIKTFSDQALSHVGFHLQTGYMATKNWQAAARFALVDVQTDFESATDKTLMDQKEIGVGGNYFLHGHDAKFQAAVKLVQLGDGKFTDAVVGEVGANVGF